MVIAAGREMAPAQEVAPTTEYAKDTFYDWAEYFQAEEEAGIKTKERAALQSLYFIIKAGEREQQTTAFSYQPTQYSQPIESYQPLEYIQQRFLLGYRERHGNPGYEQLLLFRVIPCESGWNLNPVGYYYGLAQFDPGTWASHAPPGYSYTDPWAQGWAVADLIEDLEANGTSPGSSGGWPHCWWV